MVVMTGGGRSAAAGDGEFAEGKSCSREVSTLAQVPLISGRWWDVVVGERACSAISEGTLLPWRLQ